MTQNIYDNPAFFEGYSQLGRSVHGLAGAAEWPALRAMLPDLRGLRVVDLGCGYGEFINNIRCASKFAMDMNPGARTHLNPDIRFIEQDCSLPWDLPSDSLDELHAMAARIDGGRRARCRWR